jgi:S1-C subfamily serine protease
MQLTFHTGVLAGQVYELPTGVAVIGRADECHVVVPDAGVAGLHAVIAVSPHGTATVRDLGSRQGTWADGERVTGTWTIAPGTRLAIGSVQATLGVAPAAPASAASRSARVPLIAGLVAVLVAGAVVGLTASGVFDDTPSEATGPTASTATAHTSRRPLTRREVLRLARDSTVQIVSRAPAGALEGSGWVMRSDAGHPLVVTNEHVVADAQSITVNRAGETPHPASIVGSSSCDDLALLRLDDVATIPALSFGPSPDIGDPLWIVGFPFTAADTIPIQARSGTVASVHSTLRRPGRGFTATYRDLVQIDGTVIEGNSGGPLIATESGKVVGVTTLASNATTDAYAIASSRAAEVLRYLAEGSSVPGMKLDYDDASPGPKIMGVTSRALTRAGVEPGQRITSVNGKRFGRELSADPGSLCSELPVFGNGRSETVTYAIRKPGGVFLPKVKLDY